MGKPIESSTLFLKDGKSLHNSSGRANFKSDNNFVSSFTDFVELVTKKR